MTTRKWKHVASGENIDCGFQANINILQPSKAKQAQVDVKMFMPY
jgi:hypothetical protein